MIILREGCHLLIYILGLTMIFGCSARKVTKPFDSKPIHNWVCVYNENAATQDIANFDLAVLDADSHPDLAELRTSDTILIGYVSLGEVGDYRWFWPAIKDETWILDKNPNWDSYMIDVRNPAWHKWLIQRIIPKILAKGFDGIFLDTIDTAEYLEKYHPTSTYPGAQKAMVKLIQSIKQHFPDTYIVANRGFAILRDVAAVLDAVVAESIFTTVDFQNDGQMRALEKTEYSNNLSILLAVQKKFNLEVFTLDYLDPRRDDEIRQLVRQSRELGFVPYVSTPSLDRVYLNTIATPEKQ